MVRIMNTYRSISFFWLAGFTWEEYQFRFILPQSLYILLKSFNISVFAPVVYRDTYSWGPVFVDPSSLNTKKEVCKHDFVKR